MKTIKTFEQFISEAEALKAEDSKVYVDDLALDSGEEIKAAEILGAIAASATEKEFEDYFFNQYGENAFKDGDMSKLKGYYNETKEEENKEETEKEGKKEDDGESDPTADLGEL